MDFTRKRKERQSVYCPSVFIICLYFLHISFCCTLSVEQFPVLNKCVLYIQFLMPFVALECTCFIYDTAHIIDIETFHCFYKVISENGYSVNNTFFPAPACNDYFKLFAYILCIVSYHLYITAVKVVFELVKHCVDAINWFIHYRICIVCFRN